MGYLRPLPLPLLMVLLTVMFRPAAVTAEPEVGEPAPPLSVEQLLNAPNDAVAEWDDLKGKVVVIDFWATWCGPCVASIPHLNDLAEQFKDEDITFLSVTDESRETVERFLAHRPIEGWVALDTDGSTKKAYGVIGIPHTVIVGTNGRILGRGDPRGLTPERLEAALRGEQLPQWNLFGDLETEPVTPPNLNKAAGEGNEAVGTPVATVVLRKLDAAPESSILQLGADSFEGRGANLRLLALAAFAPDEGAILSEKLVEFDESIPPELLAGGRYDVLVAAPGNPGLTKALLRTLIQKEFGVAARHEQRPTEVLVLKVAEGRQLSLPKAKDEVTIIDSREDGEDYVVEAIGTHPDSIRGLMLDDLDKFVFSELPEDLGRRDVVFRYPKGDATAAAAVLREKFGIDLVPETRELTWTVIYRTEAPATQSTDTSLP